MIYIILVPGSKMFSNSTPFFWVDEGLGKDMNDSKWHDMTWLHGWASVWSWNNKWMAIYIYAHTVHTYIHIYIQIITTLRSHADRLGHRARHGYGVFSRHVTIGLMNDQLSNMADSSRWSWLSSTITYLSAFICYHDEITIYWSSWLMFQEHVHQMDLN